MNARVRPSTSWRSTCTLTKAYTKRHHDYGFGGDPVHPIASQYYGYLTETVSF